MAYSTAPKHEQGECFSRSLKDRTKTLHSYMNW